MKLGNCGSENLQNERNPHFDEALYEKEGIEMTILSIGNSFSQDATRYLHDVAAANGEDILTANLYIGGCPLSLHHRNMLGDTKAYDFEFNGIGTGLKISIREALLSRDWDYVTLQQVSWCSPHYDTFQPYLNVLAAFVKECLPKTKLLLHETWAYQPESDNLKNLGFASHSEMYFRVHEAYKLAAGDIGADGIIPSGAVVNELVSSGYSNVHRDPIHMSLGLGRYALALCWLKYLTGKNISSNRFSLFDVSVSDVEISAAKACVDKIV